MAAPEFFVQTVASSETSNYRLELVVNEILKVSKLSPNIARLRAYGFRLV